MALRRIPTALLPRPKGTRGLAGITQRQLAEAAGISLRTVLRAEKAGVFPRFADVRERYLRALGIIEKR